MGWCRNKTKIVSVGIRYRVQGAGGKTGLIQIAKNGAVWVYVGISFSRECVKTFSVKNINRKPNGAGVYVRIRYNRGCGKHHSCTWEPFLHRVSAHDQQKIYFGLFPMNTFIIREESMYKKSQNCSLHVWTSARANAILTKWHIWLWMQG